MASQHGGHTGGDEGKGWGIDMVNGGRENGGNNGQRAARAAAACTACAMGLLVAGTAAIAAPAASPALLVPAPDPNPQSIDFTADPLIAFVTTATPPADFRGMIAAAVLGHPSLGEAESATEVAVARRTEVRSGVFPTLGAQIVHSRSVSRDFGDQTAIVESLQPSERTDATVSADQLFYDFGATSRRIASASASVASARADAARVATDMALRAVTAWYDVLACQILRDISDAAVARLEAIVADTRTRQASGLGTGGDVARAEAGLGDAMGRAARVERQLVEARARYGEVFGNPPPLRLDHPGPPQSRATAEEDAVAMSRATPAVATAVATADAAAAAARAARSDRLPRLAGNLTGAKYAILNGKVDYDLRAQIVLRATLSTGGAEAARASEASARARAAEFTRDRIEAEAARDAGSAYADANILDRNLAALEAAYRANRRARDVTVEQFRVSRGSLLDVLRVEQDLVNAATSYLRGAVERDIAHYTLLARTGEILPLFAISVPDVAPR